MKKTIFLFAFLLLSFPLVAEEVSVLEKQLPQQVPFAQPFQARLVLSHPQEDSLALNQQEPSGDFVITAQRQEQPAPNTSVFDFTVVPFTLNVSTFTVTLDILNAGEIRSSYTVEMPVTVQPVELFKDKKLREIRGPKVSVSWLKWLLILAALCILFYLLFWWRKRLQQQDDGPAWQRFGKEKDNRPCHVIALSQIDALINSGLWEHKQYKLFYITLSDILREYLWRRFSLDVSADTSAELLRHAKKVNEMAPVLPSLKEFLTSGDLVKFAKVVPSETQRNRDITYLQNLIKQTAPQPPAQKEEAQ